MITRLCGSPDEELMQKIEEKNSYAMRVVIESFAKYRRRNFRDYFSFCTNDAKFLDFIDKILVLDPERRMTVGEALAHPYMTEYYLPEDEPVTSQPFNLDEPIEHTLAQWKGIIWREIHSFQGDEKSPKIL
ncbi:hypothetical protein WR25_26618 [Diploscapter pachys]|uniref:Protein kinase domain-containing protein n=1 Tax=Diploscapter pachys TaxID=2018661 RepID=A0A2A2LBX1_9BILA|nr:hypothetical protein WR25_26618 [Diploscapter pachys]